MNQLAPADWDELVSPLLSKSFLLAVGADLHGNKIPNTTQNPPAFLPLTHLGNP